MECILLQMDFYRRCGVKDLELQVNSLGDRESKSRYRDALVAFLTPKQAAARRRFPAPARTPIPLRILDSKDPRDQEACQGAPPAAESLSDKSRLHFERVQSLLTAARRPLPRERQPRPRLRLLHRNALGSRCRRPGAQNALGGGGRYDNLVEQLGGRPTPGVGFGSGIERLLLALEGPGRSPPPPRPAAHLARRHRRRRPGRQLSSCWPTSAPQASPATWTPTGRSVKAQFKLADREQAAFCITVGENEIATATFVLKNLGTGSRPLCLATNLSRD